jgi:hypothetical protein
VLKRAAGQVRAVMGGVYALDLRSGIGHLDVVRYRKLDFDSECGKHLHDLADLRRRLALLDIDEEAHSHPGREREVRLGQAESAPCVADEAPQ